MQADAYAGFNRLYEAGRKPGPIVEAVCWVHARRKFFDLARIKKAPIAIDAIKRIDSLFAIERHQLLFGQTNGHSGIAVVLDCALRAHSRSVRIALMERDKRQG